MVFKLSMDEVLKVCGTCEKYDQNKRECRTDDSPTTSPLRTVKKCKKWDDFFGGTCLFLGH